MNDHQNSITAAYAFVALAIVAKRGWIANVKGWITKGQTSPTSANGNGIQDWQGAIGSYAILLLAAENDSLGPVSAAIAWAVAFAMALQLVNNFSNLNPAGGSAKQVGPVDTRPGSAITNPPQILI